jgi:plasmid stabilization system protein ParE
MTGKIIRKPRVDRDLVEHYLFIAVDKMAPAEEFLRVAEEGFHRPAAHPGAGREWASKLPHLEGIRFYPLPAPYRRYLVFYRPIEGGVEVLTVLRGEQGLAMILEALEGPEPQGS